MSSIRPGPVQFQAKTDREPSFGETEIASACMYLETWFEARHRTRYCDIRAERRGLQLHFDITHGKEPLADGESTDAGFATPSSDDRSFATYDEATRLLVVDALEFIREGIRTGFGHGFCGDADYFERGPWTSSYPPPMT
jgi:hypothetical protein